MKFAAFCLLVLAAWTLPAANAADPLSATLEVHKVVRAEDGKERLLPAGDAKPGDVLEYRAAYRNVSSRPLHQVAATLPIPQIDVVFLMQSAAPAAVQASTDGQNFAPAPLKRQVRLADGRIEERLVPAAAYRVLRWNLGDLPAGASKTVSARVRVTSAADDTFASR